MRLLNRQFVVGLVGVTVVVGVWVVLSVVVLNFAIPRLISHFPESRLRILSEKWRRWHADVPSLSFVHHVYRLKGHDLYQSPNNADMSPLPESEERLLTSFLYQTNEIGFRGKNSVKESYPLIGLGDSFTGAADVEYPWVDLVGKEMAVDSLNLGFPGGAGPDDSLAALINFGLAKKPRAIVFAYFEGNDLRESGDEYLPLELSFSERSFLFSFLGDFLHQCVYEKWRDSFQSQQIPGGYSDNKRNAPFPVKVTFQNRVPLEVTFTRQYVSMMRVGRKSIEETMNVTNLRNILNIMKTKAEAERARLLVAYIPSKERAYWPFVRDQREVVRAMYRDQKYSIGAVGAFLEQRPLDVASESSFKHATDENIDGHFHTFSSLLTSLGIDFIDLTPAIRSAIGEGNEPYFAFDTHWNQVGHELAAKAISRKLMEAEPSGIRDGLSKSKH